MLGKETSTRSRATMRKQRNIVVLGFSMVGKTAICVRFAKDRFDETYEPTYENSWYKDYKYKGQEVECIIKDTQGLSDQEIFRHEYGLGYHGYILVYSISSHRSLETLKGIHEKLLNLTVNTKIPRVLVGNKVDLEMDCRQVSTAEGQALAEEWGCAFVESSAKWNTSVDQIFDLLLDEVEKCSEPENSYSLNSTKCLDMLCCRPEDSLDSKASTARLGKVVTVLTVLTLLIGVLCIFAGIAVVSSTMEEIEELIAYVLFGYGFIISLISIFGVFGIRQRSQEFLRVYGISFIIIIATQIIVWMILHVNNNFQEYAMPAAAVLAVIVVIEVMAVSTVCWYQNYLSNAFGDFNGSLIGDTQGGYYNIMD